MCPYYAGFRRAFVNDEVIVPQLSPLELEKVIELVGRSPRLYPRGILEALDQHKSSPGSAPRAQSVPPNAAAVVSHNAAELACRHDIRNKPDTDQMRQAHERRLAMLRARTHNKSAPEPVTSGHRGVSVRCPIYPPKSGHGIAT
jgi:hypothetical protein